MTALWQTTWLTLGQATNPAAAADPSAVMVQSIWDFVVKGGPMMIPIGLCSFIAFAVIIERLLSLRRSQVIPPAFIKGLRKQLGNGADDLDEALDYCRRNGSAIARLCAAGIRRLGASVEVLEKYIQEAGEREVFKLRKHLRGLSVIASVAPLMGLLGTIFGMIKAFQTVATSSEALGKAELLATGIYEAMITTAAGLLLAIPVLVAYHYFSAKIERLVGEMDQVTMAFVEDYAFAHRDAATSPRFRAAAEEENESEPVAVETA